MLDELLDRDRSPGWRKAVEVPVDGIAHRQRVIERETHDRRRDKLFRDRVETIARRVGRLHSQLDVRVPVRSPELHRVVSRDQYAAAEGADSSQRIDVLVDTLGRSSRRLLRRRGTHRETREHESERTSTHVSPTQRWFTT